MNLMTVLAVNNDCYKAGRTIKVKGILVHSTGANNSTLRRYCQSRNGDKNKDAEINKIIGANTGGNDWNRPSGARYDANGKLYFVKTDKDIYGASISTLQRQVCVHGFIGKLADGSIATIQQLPWDRRGWHGGGDSNNTHIGFEICEDALTDANYFNAVYKEAAELCAYLCKTYNLNPLADGVLICHSEGYKRGIASNHGDVMHWFPKHGKSMDTFRKYVSELMGGVVTPTQPATPTSRPTLKEGAKGDDVKYMQTRLNAHGASLTVDGSFGPATLEAVKAFQKAKGLTVDGSCGPQTWTALEATPAGAIGVGDTVRINKGAKTYTGGNPASFVYDGTYPVDELSGERAVLDKKGICTAYNVKDLSLVKKAGGTTTAPTTPEPTPTQPTTPKTPIMGKSVATVAQLRAYIAQRNPAEVHLADLFIEEGAAEGVRGDFACMLSCHETGFYLFEKVSPGAICRRSMNNFGGIGALNNNEAGNAATFKDDREGVRAVIQHAKAYGSKDALKNPQVDPRFGLVTRGIAPNWEDLGGRWAVPGYDTKTYSSFDAAYAKGATYGQKIVSMLSDVLTITPEPEPVAPAPDVKKSRFFSDVPDNHWAIDILDRAYELKITSGVGNGKFGFIDERVQMVAMCVNTYDAVMRNTGKDDSADSDAE